MTLDNPPNPLVMVTLQFQDGARLSWKLGKPISQFDAFTEIGKLASKYNVGIHMEIPLPAKIKDSGPEEPAEVPNGS